MPKARLTVTIHPQTLQRLDRWVDEVRYASRSQAIEAAVAAYIDRMDRRQPIDACAMLDPVAERKLAEPGLGPDVATWPPN